MLSGETRGAGGAALARHLESTKRGQLVQRVEGRFLAASTLSGQVAEMVLAARGARTSRPLLHVHVDPSVGADNADTIRHWLRLFEAEFGLEGQPRAGVLHRGKDGTTRLHGHFVYSLVLPNHRVVDLRNSYRRREKISVITAYDLGLPFPPVPRPRSIHRALLREGRVEVARWLAEHSSAIHAPVRVSDLPPQQRHIAERTRVDHQDLQVSLLSVWPSSNADDFRNALLGRGIGLAMGEKVVLLVDQTGTPHPLARALHQSCRRHGLPAPSAAQVRAYLSTLKLPTLEQFRQDQSMTQFTDKKSRILAAVTGEQIVRDFRNRTRYVKKGPPHRILMQDGGWVLVDNAAASLTVSGPRGDADDLAEAMAKVEPFAIHRDERRQLKRLPSSIRAIGPVAAGEDDRFEWWVAKGYRPERRAGGFAVTVDGTLLLDRGHEIEVHDLPPSNRALMLIAEYAANHWGGGLELTGPPGSVDWSEKDKARLWWACQHAGVVFHGYTPPPELVQRWEAENGSGLPQGAAAFRPGAGNAKPQKATVADQIAELDRQIDAIKGQWKKNSRNQGWIERMRREIDRLEDVKAELKHSLDRQMLNQTPEWRW